MPELPYKEVGTYEIPVNGKPCELSTLVFNNGVIGWTQNTEQQCVNPQYRYYGESINPVTIYNVTKIDAEALLAQFLLILTKEKVPPEDIKYKHENLIKDILTDFHNVKF